MEPDSMSGTPNFPTPLSPMSPNISENPYSPNLPILVSDDEDLSLPILVSDDEDLSKVVPETFFKTRISLNQLEVRYENGTEAVSTKSEVDSELEFHCKPSELEFQFNSFLIKFEHTLHWDNLEDRRNIGEYWEDEAEDYPKFDVSLIPKTLTEDDDCIFEKEQQLELDEILRRRVMI